MNEDFFSVSINFIVKLYTDKLWLGKREFLSDLVSDGYNFPTVTSFRVMTSSSRKSFMQSHVVFPLLLKLVGVHSVVSLRK